MQHSDISSAGRAKREAVKTPVLGVLGGLNPRGAAQFLQTMYSNYQGPEGLAPEIVFISANKAPDRYQADPNGPDRSLPTYLEDQIRRLAFHCDRIILVSFCAQAFVGHLREPKLWSLVEITRQSLREHQQACPLLFTHAHTDQCGVFRGLGNLQHLRDRDTSICSNLIEQMATEDPPLDDIQELLRQWLQKYRATHLVAASASAHLLAVKLPELPWIDPLAIAARKWNSLLGQMQSAIHNT